VIKVYSFGGVSFLHNTGKLRPRARHPASDQRPLSIGQPNYRAQVLWMTATSPIMTAFPSADVHRRQVQMRFDAPHSRIQFADLDSMPDDRRMVVDDGPPQAATISRVALCSALFFSCTARRSAAKSARKDRISGSLVMAA
jgi:hypothetical protein